jgi:hypothetical protein
MELYHLFHKKKERSSQNFSLFQASLKPACEYFPSQQVGSLFLAYHYSMDTKISKPVSHKNPQKFRFFRREYRKITIFYGKLFGLY